MLKSTITLIDSAGVHDEAPGWGKPVLVSYEINPEKLEAIDVITVKLICTSVFKNIEETSNLLLNEIW